MSDVLALGLLSVCVAIGAHDLVARRVPNALLLAGLGLQAVSLLNGTATASGLAASLQPALLGFVLGLLGFMPLWRLGVMGAGDVKFLALLGFVLGPLGLLASWLVASVIAGVHALGVVIGQRYIKPVTDSRACVALSRGMLPLVQALALSRAWLAARRGSRRGAPYATYLAIGALMWVFIVVPSIVH